MHRKFKPAMFIKVQKICSVAFNFNLWYTCFVIHLHQLGCQKNFELFMNFSTDSLVVMMQLMKTIFNLVIIDLKKTFDTICDKKLKSCL